MEFWCFLGILKFITKHSVTIVKYESFHVSQQTNRQKNEKCPNINHKFVSSFFSIQSGESKQHELDELERFIHHSMMIQK